jgi:hypothetical protein
MRHVVVVLALLGVLFSWAFTRHIPLLYAQGFGSSPLIGEWEVRHTDMGLGRVFTFHPDSSFEVRIFRIYAGGTQVIHAQSGMYSVQGNRLNLRTKSGESAIYSWRMTRDPYVGSRILWLVDSKGMEEPYYGSR